MIVSTNFENSKKDLQSRANQAGKLASRALAQAIWDMDINSMNKTADALMLDEEMIYLRIYNDFDHETVRTRGIGKKLSVDMLKQSPRFPTSQIAIERNDQNIANVEIVMGDASIVERAKRSAISIITLSISVLIIIALVMTWVLNTVIKKPLLVLGAHAARVTTGELEHEIDVSRKDELGNLARSFKEMQGSIRKKIQDLYSLNEAGETIMDSNSESGVLTFCIKRLEEHNKFSEGSVYLYDKTIDKLKLLASDQESKSLNEEILVNTTDGILGAAVTNRKVIFVHDTNTDSRFPELKSTMKEARLAIPMIDAGQLFGVMTFSGDSSKVKFEDTDMDFCATLSRLSVSRVKSIHMIGVIEEHNRTLEKKVEERTQSLKTKTNDINAMLQNMKQGIFTFNGNLKIHHEYSAHLEKILEHNNIANQNLYDLILSHTELGSDQNSQITACLQSCFGETALAWDCNSHLLPREVNYTSLNEERKILEFDWNPTFDDDDLIEKFIVTVRDVTVLKELEKESEHQKQELNIISEIINIPQNRFNDFIKNSKNFILDNQTILENYSDKKNDDIKNMIEILFRNMHTIKGNARVYGFRLISDIVHNAEQFYDQIRQGVEQWDTVKLKADLLEVEAVIDSYEKINADKLASLSTQESDKGLTVEDLQNVQDIFDALKPKIKGEDHSLLNKVSQMIDMKEYVPVEEATNQVIKSMPHLAKTLGKENPEVIINNPRIRIPSKYQSTIEDAFTHILRNSLDHGIEKPEVRKGKGKKEAGTINILWSETQNAITATIQDDGQGLNLNKLRQIFSNNGSSDTASSVSDAELAETIFRSGMSTAETVSQISGRGVGLEAVRNFIRNLGGDIAVKFNGDKNNKGYRPIIFEIEIKKA